MKLLNHIKVIDLAHNTASYWYSDGANWNTLTTTQLEFMRWINGE